MSAEHDGSELEEFEVQLGPAYNENLLPNAAVHLKQAVKEYAEKVFREAANIEKMEYTGGGPAEIIAAHIEEAKWLSLRRMRRTVTSSKWSWVLKLGQMGSLVLIGVGGSNINELWGVFLCLGGVILASVLIIVERELAREV